MPINNAPKFVCKTHHIRSAPEMYSTKAMSVKAARAKTAMPPKLRFGPKTRSNRPTRWYPEIVIDSTSPDSQVSCNNKMSTFEFRNRASSSARRRNNLRQFTLHTRTCCKKALDGTDPTATRRKLRKLLTAAKDSWFASPVAFARPLSPTESEELEGKVEIGNEEAEVETPPSAPGRGAAPD